MQRVQHRNRDFGYPKKQAQDFKINYTHPSPFGAWANRSNAYSPGKPDKDGIYDFRATDAYLPNTYHAKFDDYYGKLFAMLVTVPVWEHARWRENFYSCFSGAFTPHPNQRGNEADKMAQDHYAANVICIQNVLNRASKRYPHTSSDTCPFSNSGHTCMQVVWSIVYRRYMDDYIASIDPGVDRLKYYRLNYGRDKIEEYPTYVFPDKLGCCNAHSLNEDDLNIYTAAADRIRAAANRHFEKFIHMVNIRETNLNQANIDYPSYSKNKDYPAHIHFLVIGSIANVNDRMLLPIDPTRPPRTEAYDQFKIIQKSIAFESNLRDPPYYGNVYHYDITFPYEKKRPTVRLTSTVLDGGARAVVTESMSEIHEKVDNYKHPEERAASPIEFDIGIEQGNFKRSMEEIARFTSFVTSNATTSFSEANYNNKKSTLSKVRYVANVLEESIPLVAENRQAVISDIKEMIIGKLSVMNPITYFSTQHQDIVEKILKNYDDKVEKAKNEATKAHNELCSEAMHFQIRQPGVTFAQHVHQLGINGHIHTRSASPMIYVHPILGETGLNDVIKYARLMKRDRVQNRDFFFDYNDVYFGFNDGTSVTLAMIVNTQAHNMRNKHYINGLVADFIIDLCTKWGDTNKLIERYEFINSALISHMLRIVNAFERQAVVFVEREADTLYRAIVENDHANAFNAANRILLLLDDVSKYHKLA
jgi:hypothetical protein